jgi:hypothetical protein
VPNEKFRKALKYSIASCSFVMLMYVFILQTIQEADAGVGLNVNVELNHHGGDLVEVCVNSRAEDLGCKTRDLSNAPNPLIIPFAFSEGAVNVGEGFNVCARNERVGIENCETGINTEKQAPENLVLEVPYSEAPTNPPNQIPPTSDQEKPGITQVTWRIQDTYGSEPIQLTIFGSDRGWTFYDVTPEVLPPDSGYFDGTLIAITKDIDSFRSNGEILRMCVKPTYQGVEPTCQDIAVQDGVAQGVFYWDYDETNPNHIIDPNDLRQEKMDRYNEWLSQQNNSSTMGPELSSPDFSFLAYMPS